MGEFAELDGEYTLPSRHAYKGKAGYGAGKPWHERVTTWTSRDGRVTRLKDLGDSHLENIISFLRRKAEHSLVVGVATALEIDAMVTSEAAQDAINSEIVSLLNTTTDDVLTEMPIYRALCREADRRAALLGFVPAIDMPVYPIEHHRPRRALTRYDDKHVLDDGWGD